MTTAQRQASVSTRRGGMRDSRCSSGACLGICQRRRARMRGIRWYVNFEKDNERTMPLSKDVSLMTDPDLANSFTCLPESTRVPGPRKMLVLVCDVAYATYRSVLYHVRRRRQSFVFRSYCLQMSCFTAAASSIKPTATIATATSSDSQSSYIERCR